MEHMAKGALGKQGNIPWIEPLGFVKVRFALVQMASPPLDTGQRFKNPAVIRHELVCLLIVTHRRVVILQEVGIAISFCQYGLTEVRLKSNAAFASLPHPSPYSP